MSVSTCRDKCQRELGGSDLSEKRATESILPSLLGKGEKGSVRDYRAV